MAKFLIYISAAAVFMLIAAVFCRNAQKSWRYEEDFNIPYAGIPEARMRALGRAVPCMASAALFLALSCLVVAVLSLPIGTYGLREGSVAAWKIAVLGVPVSLFMLSLVGMLSVMWFNWPKSVVAPHLRTEPGQLQEFLRRRQRKGGGMRR
jgi:hypothetical protein